MNSARDTQIRAWTLIIGILLILALTAGGIILVVRQGMQQVQKAVNPVTGITSNLGTQVARALNPTPTIIPDPITVIYQVRSLARLETVQYSVEKVITAETGQEFFGTLFGDRLLFVAHGVVIAGVDLAKLGPQDLRVQDGVLYVRMPEPELFVVTLDNDKSYVYNRETGLLTHGDINLESNARRAAEDVIREVALEDGILDQARQNAENYLYRLLRDLGYPDVIFVEPTPTPAP
jgi:hypothetical protein